MGEKRIHQIVDLCPTCIERNKRKGARVSDEKRKPGKENEHVRARERERVCERAHVRERESESECVRTKDKERKEE